MSFAARFALAAALSLGAAVFVSAARADEPDAGAPLFHSVISPDGAQLWANRCAGCHSPDGSGTRHPNHKLPDFRAEAWQSRHDAARIAQIVHDGRKEDHMPSFATRLSAEEIQAVAAYVKTLK